MYGVKPRAVVVARPLVITTYKSTRKLSCAYFDSFNDFSHSLITGDLTQQNLCQNMEHASVE